MTPARMSSRLLISIHALLAESDALSQSSAKSTPEISIHALLAESDTGVRIASDLQHTFLSTLSLRRATNANLGRHRSNNNFYPRSPCGERHQACSGNQQPADFYPRSPCGERQSTGIKPILGKIFLSTLSLRRATQSSAKSTPEEEYFYPRSPCGERRQVTQTCHIEISISIHALLAESDRLPTALRTPHHKFLSTLSLRRATQCRL